MSCENYKQYDNRWASKRYAGDTMAGSGCGPTAVANIVQQMPTEVAKYIESKGGTVSGHGTIWSYIDVALDHFGYNGRQLNGTSLYGVQGSAAETTWKNAMWAGNHYGILLMGPGVFTKGGHYITITEYDGNRCYVHDPASAARDGWHPWSDFEGRVKVFYLADRADRKDSAGSGAEETSVNTYSFGLEQIDLGSVGIYVLLAQEILLPRGFYKGTLDRSFGPLMEAAVRAYQKSRGFLAVDGSLGAATWADLLALPKRNGLYVLKQVKTGDQGVEVLLLQEILKARGYYKGGLDWSFGPQTEKAARKYQADRGLKVDGVAGPETWKDLIAL
ncbi:peptidoglycan-binding protein [Wansuia hejianensis]|uniref:Peptidoglycan-binding protein n=1 Tax=Wansuia hejianensis TaxID=2763667 RepID=A0A7G9GB74_9FIRM|nr:peptidoglycan-binding protein [Wansuia hejianensis]QNM08056.1 peptidoglycan-binding protein [Wansuia hejianensis]RHV86960.1 hypothetical protein DXA96_14320 [Lachnospiraceae bacterium OF09-33XD]